MKKNPMMLMAAMKKSPSMPMMAGGGDVMPPGEPAGGGSSDEDSAGMAAMSDLIAALKAGDASMAWDAFKAADQASDMMLNQAGPEPEEAEEPPAGE